MVQTRRKPPIKYQNENEDESESESYEKKRVSSSKDQSSKHSRMLQTRRNPSSTKIESENEIESYEEKRKQRLEENKKKMEQLNLLHLSQAALNAPKPKRSYVKKPKVEMPRDWQPRRSSRMSDKSLPSYKEQKEICTDDELSTEDETTTRSDEVDTSDEEELDAIVRAEKLKSSLGSDFPTFVKRLHYSHKSTFNIPKIFGKTHLRNQDQMLTLVDEDGHEWRFNYTIRTKHNLNGWGPFVNHHQLVDGDVLVFQLVEPATFKVYIIRGDASGEDGQQGSEES